MFLEIIKVKMFRKEKKKGILLFLRKFVGVNFSGMKIIDML